MLLYVIRAFRDVLTVSPSILPLGFARGHAKTQSVEIYRSSHYIPRRSRKGLTNIADKNGAICRRFTACLYRLLTVRETKCFTERPATAF